MVFVEQAFSSPLNEDGGGGSSGSGSSCSSGGIISRSALMHLAGVGKVNLVNYSTCLHRLARVVASLAHPGDRDDNG